MDSSPPYDGSKEQIATCEESDDEIEMNEDSDDEVVMVWEIEMNEDPHSGMSDSCLREAVDRFVNDLTRMTLKVCLFFFCVSTLLLE